MKDASRTIREEIRGILVFVGVIWAVFLVDRALFFVEFNEYLGLAPRTLWGIVGIPAMPLLHAGFGHLSGNTIPLLVLLCLLAGSKVRSWAIVANVVVFGGVLLWIFGRGTIDGLPAKHVGASGLVFGLIAFLILSGVFERRIIPLMVTVIVTLFYGGTLIWGVLPGENPHVSWDGHLCGVIAGGLVAYTLTKSRQQKNVVAEEA